MKNNILPHYLHKSPPNLQNSQLNLLNSQPNLQKSRLNLLKSLFQSLSMLFLFATLGCERIIDVDLNDASPQIVIEGNLSWGDARLEVKISETGSYFSVTPSARVNNAKVYLENNTGMRNDAKSTGNGMYAIESYPQQFGMEYRLIVEADGQKYEAESTLYPPVEVDSLAFEFQPDMRFFEGGYRLLLYFSDPPDEENFYRIKVSKNGELLSSTDDLIVFDDSGLDGRAIQVRLRRQLFDIGDTAKVQLMAIDEKAFIYFTTFREMANTNPGSPAPANPVSNFSNGALGYFSAWSLTEKEIVIGD